MSWPLATFLIVGLVLLAGWLAYERSQPSARMVAVVATLAAVAALGRDAFVALPEVKPITAIVLVVGYVLGPLPGFTVGAIGMLASNVMLGQGPYTPWQMAAWGMVGVAGAVLGRLTGRRLGRLPLALACGLAALAATEVMNVYTWTLGATHTLAAFLLIAGATALSFNLVDAGASFLFGLAFAPELARVLIRMRARMDVRWEAPGAGVPALAETGMLAERGMRAEGECLPASVKGECLPASVAVALGLAGVGLLGGGSPARADVLRPVGAPTATASSLVSPTGLSAALPFAAATAHPARENVSPEIAYLASAQDSNGGWGAAAGQPPSELYSAWAALGLAAAGRPPQSVRRDGHTLLEALRAQAGTLEGPGDLERTMLALRACGAPVTSLAGKNLLAGLLHYRAADGSFSHQVNLTAFAVFALRAAGYPASNSTVRAAGAWIAGQQDSDGGFNFAERGGSSDADDTAAALQGLVDAGTHGGAGVSRAVAFLVHTQNPDGGFPEQPGGESNAQSTAWAIQGLVAAGLNVEAVRHRGSRSPLGYLESLVAPNGSVRYSRTSAQTPVWVTAQALTALARAPFPIG
jgi:Prenyltransferase and squalene oxidase repeat